MSKQITVLVFVLSQLIAPAQADSLAFHDFDSVIFHVPLFNTDADEGENGPEQQDISGLLQASRDVFSQFASFQFGQARFRMRGLTPENHQVMINGIDLGNPESGISSWSTWAGLNDVTRYVESRFGNTANRYNFSGIGGYTNIDSRASSFKRTTRVSYTASSRIYRHRFMFTHSSGMNRRGWAHSIAASARTGDEVYIPGTYFRAWALYGSVDKKINQRHLFSLTSLIAPVEQGRQSAAVMEAYTLAGDNYYNSAWGWQNGKVRNSRVSHISRPTVMLSHIYTPNSNSRLNTSICFQGGRNGFTGINMADADNPRPDYYKYLPSYHYLSGDSAAGDLLQESWKNDPLLRQVNWDELIRLNKNNLYSDPSEGAQVTNTTDTRARYILEERVERQKLLLANVVWNRHHGGWFFSAGGNAKMYSSRKYKLAEDLLGASFWIDEDQFADNLGVEDFIKQNDIDNPNKKIRTGDKFGYDYSIQVRRLETWAQAEYNFRRLEFYAAASLSGTRAWREGHVANGKFPVTSKGQSEQLSMINSGIRGGVTFKISGRQFLHLNGSMLNRPPAITDIFVSPTVRNDLVTNLTAEKVTGAELSYNFRAPSLKVRITAYHSQVNDQVWLRTYWHDTYKTTVNMIMKGVNNVYKGFEIALEKKFSGRHVLQAAFAPGQAVYKGQPVLEAWQDNNSTVIFANHKVYLNNYRSNSSPQLAAGASYRLNGKKYWFVVLSFNYFDQIYIDVNPERRTEEAAGKFLEGEHELAMAVVAQQRLPAWYLANLSAGRSFRIKHKYFLNFNLSLNNLLNNTTTITSGFEQLRWNPSIPGLFPAKYNFLPGRSFMLITNFSF